MYTEAAWRLCLGSSESVRAQILLHTWILFPIMAKRKGSDGAAGTADKHTRSPHADSAARPVKHNRTAVKRSAVKRPGWHSQIPILQWPSAEVQSTEEASC